LQNKAIKRKLQTISRTKQPKFLCEDNLILEKVKSWNAKSSQLFCFCVNLTTRVNVLMALKKALTALRTTPSAEAAATPPFPRRGAFITRAPGISFL
jgi:hypothetical protein